MKTKKTGSDTKTETKPETVAAGATAPAAERKPPDADPPAPDDEGDDDSADDGRQPADEAASQPLPGAAAEPTVTSLHVAGEPPRASLATFLLGRPLAIARRQLDALLAVLLREGAAGELELKALFGGDDEEREGKGYDVGVDGLATIPVHGILVNHEDSIWARWFGCPSYQGLRKAFDAALSDERVKAIAFDMDTPGGEVDGCFDLVDHLFASRGSKPISALVNTQAFSAGYAIASAADRIYVSRDGGTGSIGVICEHWDYSGMLEQAGIVVTAIFAGAKKNDGSPYEPLSDSAKKTITALVDETYGVFVSTVARNRNLSEEKVRGTEAGIYFGAAGVSAGLADALMPIEQARAAAAGQEVGVSAVTRLEGELAAARAETANASKAALEAFRGWMHDVLARAAAVRRPDVAARILEDEVPAAAVNDRFKDLLAESPVPELRNVIPGAQAGMDPAVALIVAGLNDHRR